MNYYNNNLINETNEEEYNYAFDYNSPLSKDPIESGEYKFEVVNYEKNWFQGSEKLIESPSIIIEISITGNDGKTYCTKDNFYLQKKMEWKLTAFRKSVHVNANTIEELFSMACGKIGKAEIEPKKYGGFKVKRYL